MKKSLLLLFSLFLFSNTSYSSHFSSAELYYHYIGQLPNVPANTYRFYLTVYRNTDGALPRTIDRSLCAVNAATNQILANASLIYQDPSMPLDSAYKRTPQNPYGWIDMGQDTIDNLAWKVTNSTYCTNDTIHYAEYRYVGEINLPSREDLIQFRVIDLPCCRSFNNNLASNGELHLQCLLNNKDSVNNNSVRPGTENPFSYCVRDTGDSPVRYNLYGFEGDGDSIAYSLIQPKEYRFCASTGTKIPYKTGFSSTNPFPSITPFKIDHKNRWLEFTPSQAGSYVLKILASEYRKNAAGNYSFFGATERDIMITIVSAGCSSVAQDTLFKVATPPVDSITCTDTVQTISINRTFLGATVEPGGSDFMLTDTAANSINILKAVSRPGLQEVQLTFPGKNLHDGLYFLTARVGTDSNTIFTHCNKQLQKGDTLAVFDIVNCPADTSGNDTTVGLPTYPKQAIDIYPVPAHSILKIKWPEGMLANTSWIIRNITGKGVMRGKRSERLQSLSIAHLPEGVYWIETEIDGALIRKKFLKG